MTARRIHLLLSAALLQGCLTREETYVEMVREQLARGPVAACCSSRTDNETQRLAHQACEAAADSRCGFVRGATVTKRSVLRFGHDDGAMVEVDVAGPAGAGTCKFQVYRLGGLQHGGCDRRGP